MVDRASTLSAAEAVEGAPSTLGYSSPEVTALRHSQQPSGPLDMHKDDVWAVGVMGLLWLSKGQDMPFGPTRHQAKMLANPQFLAEAKERVRGRHLAWVSPSTHFSHSSCFDWLPYLWVFPYAIPASHGQVIIREVS